MRSPSFAASFMGGVPARSLAQARAERDAFIEHKAFAAPSAVLLRRLLEVFQDATLEVIDLGKAVGEQIRARLLAADAPGAEHRDPPVPYRIEVARGKFPELSKACELWIDGAIEGAHRNLEGVAGV